MAKRRKYKPKDIANALKINFGMVYVTARKVGCSHQTIYNYIDQYPECREAYEEQSGFMVDTAELGFYKALKREEPWAINKMLSTKGRKRGYGDELNIKAQITLDDIKDLGDAQILALLASGASLNGHHTGSPAHVD